MSYRKDPIIITGVGHSGTRGFVELVLDSNIYCGDTNNKFREWEFYRRLSTTVCAKLYGLKDPHNANTIPIKKLYNEEHYKKHYQETLKYVKEQITNNKSESMPDDKYSKWMFKTPRTSFALDLWFEIFPQAKLINLIRDGRDVAFSIPKSGIKGKIFNIDYCFYGQFAKAASIFLKKRGLQYNFMIWEERLKKIEYFRKKGIPIKDFRYEDLIDKEKVKDLCKYIGIAFNELKMDRLRLSQGKGTEAMKGIKYNTEWLKKYGYIK